MQRYALYRVPVLVLVMMNSNVYTDSIIRKSALLLSAWGRVVSDTVRPNLSEQCLASEERESDGGERSPRSMRRERHVWA